MAQSERDGSRNNHDIDSDPPSDGNRKGGKFSSQDLASRPPLFVGMKQRQYGGGRSDGSRARTSEEIIRDHRRQREEQKQRTALQIGLTEAYRRTDENGGFIPKTSTSVDAPAGNMRDHEKDIKSPELASQSRIPRSSVYSSRGRANAEDGISSSPPKANAFSRPRWEDRDDHAPADSESDSTGPREGSPSPAPIIRNRRNRDGNGGLAAPLDRDRISGANPLFVKNKPQDSASTFAARRGVGPKVAETTKTLEKKTSMSSLDDAPEQATRETGTRVAETARTLARKTSASSFEDMAEPPIRVPRSWGTRAKNTSGAKWMAKILSPDPSMDMKDLQLGAGGYQAQAPDAPLPTIEDISSVQEPTPPSSRPSSAQPRSGSPEKSKMWDADVDFTAHSLQISTSPQLRVRNTKLDEIRSREIQSLTARALASNRLEEIRERNSEERSILSDTPRINDGESVPAANLEENQEPGQALVERTILEEEGYPIPGTPVTVFPGGSYRPRSGSRSGRNSSLPRQEDSHDTLRALSRVLSVSPAPPEAEEIEGANQSDKKLGNDDHRGDKGMKRGEFEVEKPSDRLKAKTNISTKPSSQTTSERPLQRNLSTGRLSDRDAVKAKRKSVEIASENPGVDVDMDIKRRSRTSSPPKSDADPEERITAEAMLFELQDNKSERNSIRAVSPSPASSDDGKLDETPRPKADPLSRPTPRVTGAYIETPLPTVRKVRHARSSSLSSSPREEVDTSDFAALPPESRRSQSTSRIAAPTDESQAGPAGSASSRLHSSKQPPVAVPQPRRRIMNSAKPTTAAEDLRRLKQEGNYEDSTFEDLGAIIDAGGKAAQDLQAKVDDLDSLPALNYDEKGRPLSDSEKQRRLQSLTLEKLNQHLRNTSSSIRDARQGIERLEHQVSSTTWEIGRERDDRIYLQIPVPRLWVRVPPSTNPDKPQRKRKWKLTWLGFFLSFFTSWYFAESVMCDIYCYPKYSSYPIYNNNWTRPDPYFPWVIPTKIDHWSGDIFSSTALKTSKAISGLLGLPETDRRKQPRRPFGGYDWWSGRDGPAPRFPPRPSDDYDDYDDSSFSSDEEIL